MSTLIFINRGATAGIARLNNRLRWFKFIDDISDMVPQFLTKIKGFIVP